MDVINNWYGYLSFSHGTVTIVLGIKNKPGYIPRLIFYTERAYF